MTPERYQQVKRLFLQAVEVDATQRMDWLDRHCGEDALLKEQVKSLLDHDADRTLFDVPPTTSAASVDEPAAQLRPARPDHQSRTLGILKSISPRSRMIVGVLAVLLPVVLSGWIANRVLDRFKKQLRVTSLNQAADEKAHAVRFWLSREQDIVQSWADSSRVRQLIDELVQIAVSAAPEQRAARLQTAAQQAALQQELTRLAKQPLQYAVWDLGQRTIALADLDRARLGSDITANGSQRLTAALRGRGDIRVIATDDPFMQGSTLAGKSSLGVLVPVRNPEGHVIAALFASDTPAEEALGELIRSSSNMPRGAIESRTFVFDRSGLLLYDSPFDAQLQWLGLLPESSAPHSAKQLSLRDPGADLTRGQTPRSTLSGPPGTPAQRLTKMASMAIHQGSGSDVDGYRDVRGVMVAGAWRWLDEYQLGIGIEIDCDAVEPVIYLAQLQSWALLTVLGTSLGIAGFAIVSVRRLRSRLLSEHRIGPYLLDRMVGEGGMGRVFLARHELLKRPTAIKLLRPEVTNEITAARFQDEAQLAARLEHPNTVNVYDFGVTEAGECYLVMEWIDGLTLDQLVARDGALPVDRSIRILRQVAQSLREAHGLALIHRDLKPQNVMVTHRASESDVVKVLDFGLARDLFHRPNGTQIPPSLIAGSPRYMAPERWDPTLPAGPATDIYAFGCIAYFILTGDHAIEGDSLEAICENAVAGQPKRPSARRGKAIPGWIDDLVMQCMAKDVSQRPLSFDEVLTTLQASV